MTLALPMDVVSRWGQWLLTSGPGTLSVCIVDAIE